MIERDADVLTFDCYGTLIDWRAGLLADVRRATGVDDLDEARFLDAREAEENRIEAAAYRPYREVVGASVLGAAARLGLHLSAVHAAEIATGVGAWPPFPDTRAALGILGTGRRLAIISNVERRDIERSIEQIGVPFAEVVTAEDVQAYKPSTALFEEMRRRLDVPADRVLHVAQSLHHDIRPAGALGLQAVWINRRGEAVPEDVTFLAQFPDLAGLAAALGPAG